MIQVGTDLPLYSFNNNEKNSFDHFLNSWQTAITVFEQKKTTNNESYFKLNTSIWMIISLNNNSFDFLTLLTVFKQNSTNNIYLKQTARDHQLSTGYFIKKTMPQNLRYKH